jgi:hypothetical protein
MHWRHPRSAATLFYAALILDYRSPVAVNSVDDPTR